MTGSEHTDRPDASPMRSSSDDAAARSPGTIGEAPAAGPIDAQGHDSSRRRPVGPVMQFTLLIVPMVMSAFFLVYALTGWVLEGRDRLNWQLEAESVALWVGLGIIGYALLTASYARLRGASRWHPVVVSGLGHAVVALLLMLSILVATRL